MQDPSPCLWGEALGEANLSAANQSPGPGPGLELEVGDVLRCCPPHLGGGAHFPTYVEVHSGPRSTSPSIHWRSHALDKDKDRQFSRSDVAVQTSPVNMT